MTKVRILRIMEYEGEVTSVLNTLRNGYIPANGEYSPTSELTIRSGVIGFPDFLPINTQPSEDTTNVPSDPSK